MPHKSVERRREVNRDWHRKQRDGQCEAVTKAGVRCSWQGQFDGYSGEVRCNLHAK